MKTQLIAQRTKHTKQELAVLGFGYLLKHPVTGRQDVPSIWIDDNIAFDAEYRGKEIAFRSLEFIRAPLLGHELVHHQQFLSYVSGAEGELAYEHGQARQGNFEPSEYRAALTEAFIYRIQEVEGVDFPMSTAAQKALHSREEFSRWFNRKSDYPAYFGQVAEVKA